MGTMGRIPRTDVRTILLVCEAPGDTGSYSSWLPPLGILTLAAVLEQRGYQCDVIDCSIAAFDVHRAARYDLIGFSVFCSNVENTGRRLRQLRALYPDKQLIIGGPHSSLAPRLFMERFPVDAVFAGESERSIVDYLTIADIAGVRGVYFRTDAGPAYNGPSLSVPDLDRLPLPAYDKVDLRAYYCYPYRARPIAGIMTSRGCPGDCIFCCHSLGTRWRPRSAAQVVAEIEYLIRRGVNEICINDDNFTLDKKRILEISRLIEEKGIKVLFQLSNGVRADTVDEEIVCALKNMGVWFIPIAPETGDDAGLSKIRKGFVLQDVRRAVTLFKKHGIVTHAFYILGFPWDNEASYARIRAFARELDTDMAQFARLSVYPVESQGVPAAAPGQDGLFLDSGVFVRGALQTNAEDIERQVGACYRSFYLRPSKMISLISKIGFKNVIGLGRYAIQTRNI